MANNIPRHSLANLDDHILEDITKREIRSDLDRCACDGALLGKISKTSRRHWKSQAVRREFPLSSRSFIPPIGDDDKVKSLVVAMKEFSEAGNLKALFREGITNFLDNRRIDRQKEGLTQLGIAAERGHVEARFLYGLYLISTNVTRRAEAFNMLSSLMKPMLVESLEVIEELRINLLNGYIEHLTGSEFAMVQFLGDYDRNCNCPDDTVEKIKLVDEWRVIEMELDPETDLDPIYHQCFWEYETNILFEILYKEV